MRKSISICSLLFVSTTGLSSTCIASTETDNNSDEIIVTATRIPTPEAQLASSVTVITAAEITARQLQTLPDVLRDVPGLNVVQTGGIGGQTSVFMRGTNSNHTKVLVDGIDVSDPSSPSGLFDFGHFLTHDISRVEVLRGPQSGLYGSDAIGGVINVITHSGSGPVSFTGRAEGGSFDTFNQSGGLKGSMDRFHYTANVQHLHSGATPVTPLDLLVPGERRIDDSYDNLSGSTKLGFTVRDDLDIGFVGRYTDTHLRNTGDNYNNFPATPDSAQSQSITRQYYSRGTVHLALFDGVFDQTLGVAYNKTKSDYSSPDGPPNTFSGNRFKADWQGNIKFADTEILILGAEHEKDKISDPISASNTIDSGYAELQSSFSERFFDTFSMRYDEGIRFGGKGTFRIAPAYLITETNTKFKLSVGSGFKAPTLSEMYQNFAPYFFGNPNLKPESSVGYDVSVEQRWGQTIAFGATYFHNNIKNLITSITTVTGTFTYGNVGRAMTDGFETFVVYEPTAGFKVRADYTFTQAFDEIKNQELLRRPKHKASATAEWRATAKFSLSPTILYFGSWIDVSRNSSIPRLNAGSYTVGNIAANFDLTPRWSIFGRIDNIGGRHYENPVGFLQPSRGIFAGIKTVF